MHSNTLRLKLLYKTSLLSCVLLSINISASFPDNSTKEKKRLSVPIPNNNTGTILMLDHEKSDAIDRSPALSTTMYLLLNPANLSTHSQTLLNNFFFHGKRIKQAYSSLSASMQKHPEHKEAFAKFFEIIEAVPLAQPICTEDEHKQQIIAIDAKLKEWQEHNKDNLEILNAQLEELQKENDMENISHHFDIARINLYTHACPQVKQALYKSLEINKCKTLKDFFDHL